MKIVARYLPVILLCLSTTPCFSSIKQDTNSQSLISFRDFSQQMPKSNCRMSAVDGLKKKKKKSFKELNLKKRENGYSINDKNPFLAMEISPSKETAGQIRWVAPKPVSGSEVKAIVLYLKKYDQSIHINTGGHGKKDGTTVFNNPSKADVRFIKEDIQTIWNTPNVSFSVMNTYVPAIYPKGANHVIDAWCYSLCTSIKVSLPHFSHNDKNQALKIAAVKNYPKAVKLFFGKSNIPITWVLSIIRPFQENEKYALQLAAERGHLEVVKEILPYASQKGKDSALKRAAMYDRLEMVKELLPHASQKYKDKALWHAAWHGHLDVVKYLLSHASKKGIDEVLELAACKGQLEVVKEILPYASQKGKDSTLKRAACKGQLEVVKLLIPQATQDGKNKALKEAAWNSHLEIVKEFLPHADQKGKDAALRTAAERGHLGVVKYLLPHASQLVKDNALSNAALCGHLEVVKYLLLHASQEGKDEALKWGLVPKPR